MQECVCHDSLPQRSQKTALWQQWWGQETGQKCMWRAYSRAGKSPSMMEGFRSADTLFLVSVLLMMNLINNLWLVFQGWNLTDEWKSLIAVVVIPRPQSTVLSVPNLHTVLLLRDAMNPIIWLISIPVTVLKGWPICPLHSALLSSVMQANPNICWNSWHTAVHKIVDKHIFFPAVDRGEFGRFVSVWELSAVQICLSPCAVQGKEAVTVTLKFSPEQWTCHRLVWVWELHRQCLCDLDVSWRQSPRWEAAEQ